MPMHDKAGIDSDSHTQRLVQFRHAVDHGLQPAGFYALTGQMGTVEKQITTASSGRWAEVDTRC